MQEVTLKVRTDEDRAERWRAAAKDRGISFNAMAEALIDEGLRDGIAVAPPVPIAEIATPSRPEIATAPVPDGFVDGDRAMLARVELGVSELLAREMPSSVLRSGSDAVIAARELAAEKPRARARGRSAGGSASPKAGKCPMPNPGHGVKCKVCGAVHANA